MFDLIIIILICALIFGGVFDFIFGFLKGTIKVVAAIVLIIAAAWLGIKLFIFFIPWMFVIALVAFLVGLVWLLKAIF